MSKIDDYNQSKEETYNKVKIRQLINFDSTSTQDVKISVVIPIFNVEDFLGPCLDSVLNQTFNDFEVICVNDGSTDSSLEILKEYLSKDDRIKIIDKDNAGYGHTMNIGLDMASGKYFLIVESDDYVLPTMFETLFEVAEKYDLDFVKSDFYRFYGDNDNMVTDYQKLDPSGEYYNKVFSTSEDHNTYKLLMNTWTGLYNLDFLRENNIRHSETPGASYQDNGFWFKTFYYGKKVMFVPEPFYMYRRDNPNSSVKNKTKVYAMDTEYDLINDFLEERGERADFMDAFTYAKYHNFHFTMDRIDLEFKKDFLMNSSKLFNQMRDEGTLNDSLLEEYDQNILRRIVETPEEYYDYIYNIDCENYDYLKKYMQCRIDVKNYGISGNGNDIDLIDSNDPLCEFYKPMWFNDHSGRGSILTSTTGSLNLTYKCINEGKLVFSFKSMDIRDKNGYRIPIYIDYTEIIIDGENLVTGSMVCWHDKPYVYEKRVNNGQMINVQLKWRPINPGSILKLDSVYDDVLDIFSSSRLDIKNIGNQTNDVLIDIKNIGTKTDDEVIEKTNNSSYVISKPDWFNDASGKGTVITSDANSLDFSLKCVNDGELVLKFRAIDQRDKSGNRIPILVEYDSIKVDSEELLDKSKVLWHDEPFTYKKKVKDGQVINIKYKWDSLKSENNINLISDSDSNLNNFSYCQVDLKNYGGKSNNLVILDHDDDLINISQPNWFSDSKGTGTIVNSNKGILNLSLKVIKDGNLVLNFKPLEMKDKNGNIIPTFIDYKSIFIDGKVLVNGSSILSSEEPLTFNKKVKDGQIINISLKWAPINQNSNSYSILKKERENINQIKKLKKQIKQLKSENDNLKEFNNSVLNSNSWKITKPLRKLK